VRQGRKEVIFRAVFAVRILRSGDRRNLMLDGLKLQQLPITMQNFVAVGKRISGNEDLNKSK